MPKKLQRRRRAHNLNLFQEEEKAAQFDFILQKVQLIAGGQFDLLGGESGQ